ncbi:hypothetical protein [Liquorilactobacillus hordei]|uniref:Uncharacterized protein n=1 Tax=Liquorilactobacillus hordei DSM 19519 TaxID=1423759 RepID=A0A0R1MJ26_9LACO|nr:hypothetical protein [Liquorilactobacillus hordei]KRL08000.1 hypothetical protein FC92_GL001071 [Liquorilactobacillus hordei DSM 19519]QYH51056.1 hypothetical protein G6O70_00390 [Liquorilactobacillus hordei DSM 19519]
MTFADELYEIANKVNYEYYKDFEKSPTYKIIKEELMESAKNGINYIYFNDIQNQNLYNFVKQNDKILINKLGISIESRKDSIASWFKLSFNKRDQLRIIEVPF